MSRWIVVLLLVAGPAAAQEFTVERAAIVRALFQDTTEQPAEEADPDSQAAAPVREAVISAQWRGLNLEAWGGIIGSKHSMWSLGLGLSFSVTDNIALAFRAEYNQELGAARDYRPQLRTAIFEPGVRFHLDFHDRIALYTNHGLSVAAQYAFYKVDGRVRGSDVGKVFSLAVGTASTIGLEFGDDFTRGFVESGLRTHFAVLQEADRAVRGFQDNLRDDFRFQWLVFRLGIRLYL